MDKPIRIRAEDGSVVDLAKIREHLVRVLVSKYPLEANKLSYTLLNALEAALSAEYIEYGTSDKALAISVGAYRQRKTTRQAARVVEER